MKHFILGAFGYPLLELCWRGRTHASMALAGGLSLMLIHHIGQGQESMASKAVMCSAGITGIEALCGLVWNRKHQIWDYRHMPLNWRGQICLPFSVMWCVLSAALLMLDKACQDA